MDLETFKVLGGLVFFYTPFIAEKYIIIVYIAMYCSALHMSIVKRFSGLKEVGLEQGWSVTNVATPSCRCRDVVFRV